ncbi:trimeric intracellular cation channel family protein [Psychroserpens sp.]|uniref:trimeric intracellular cation channel family protein n=1 Tax=Psychroserpens sp. TaxID=2020870 RepID=UPI001B2CBBE5|nr:trimeric intracellular cation channel family protein [Psychroserpens sp.]MBO6607126.1 trimeric intracellular cation channel family protein [Psychroserpens sp.]MBO6654272.1 trimeric intracellular cation channel family protein [Psychroserpens sp.]MBO6682442.1 trimeric intracellular cation channel family protein [Psychroserpens sp.]MBO6750898.1 trimeric intracellular cation channel family protein [Psychroserpens sp.]MBO6915673.1 trimeric intracellular cation channel family protein [Psychroserp
MFFQVVDILGTVAFAISGVLVALEKRMDAFGVLIIAFVTAVGGGTLRDMMVGIHPVSWMTNITYVYVIISSTVLAVVFKKQIYYLRKSLFLFDTIGIGLYTVVGIETGIVAELHPIICVALGTMTACFGGVIRDILCNEIPIIFRKEIYATPCILGGFSYFLLREFVADTNFIFVIAGLIVIIMRLIAVRLKISLPSLYKS